MFPLKLIGIPFTNARDYFDCGGERLKDVAIGHVQLGAATKVAGEFLKCGLKIGFPEKDSRHGQPVQFPGKRFRIDEGRAGSSNGRVAPRPSERLVASSRHIARIHCCGIEAGHVRRRHHPGQAGVVEPHGPVPILHRQHFQANTGERFFLKLAGQFANRPAVPDRDRMHADERAVIGTEEGAFGRSAIDRIRPIQDNHVGAVLLAGPQAKIKGPDKSVVTGADILQIDQENIEIAQHFRGWLPMFAVQAINRNMETRMLVTLPFDHVVLSLAKKTVLGAEQGRRPEIVRHHVAPEHGRRAPASRKRMPDEEERRSAHPEVSPARARPGDREARQPA